ncbi:MAG: VTT domain-containing protein [Trueperaceae bacterium]
MIDGLTALINSQGWLAPLWYVAGFLLTALVPIVPSPLIAAIGGTAFGTVPAIFYGLIGMGLGAALSLSLARQLGRPIVRRMVPESTWIQWEAFLGVKSYVLWFVIFILLNMDIVVMASGLSSLSSRGLWLTAMAARIPWLIGAAWFGHVLLVNDAMLILVVILMVPILYGVSRMRPALQAWLGRMALRAEGGERLAAVVGDAAEPSPPGGDRASGDPARTPSRERTPPGEMRATTDRHEAAGHDGAARHDEPSLQETRAKFLAARRRKRRIH